MSLVTILGFIFTGHILTMVKSRYNYLLLTILFLVLIATRGLEVPDTDGYSVFFTNVNFGNYKEQGSYFELGFTFFTCIVKLITSNYLIYFGLIALINIIGIRCFFEKIIFKDLGQRNVNYLLYGILSYVAFFGLYYNAIVLRAGIALTLLLLILIEPNKLRKIALLVLAILFHSSAVLIIVVWFIYEKSFKISQKGYIIVGLIILGIHYSGLSFLVFFSLLDNIKVLASNLSGTNFERFLFYINNNLTSDSYQISLRLLLYEFSIFVFVMSTAFRKSILFVKFLNVFTVGIIIQVLLIPVIEVARITDYFLIAYVPLCWYSLLLSSKDNYKKRMFYILFFLIVTIVQSIFFYRIL